MNEGSQVQPRPQLLAAYFRALIRLRRSLSHEIRDHLNAVQLNVAVAENAAVSGRDSSQALIRVRRGAEAVKESVLALLVTLDPEEGGDGDLRSALETLARLVAPLARSLGLTFWHELPIPTNVPVQRGALRVLLVAMVDLLHEGGERVPEGEREVSLVASAGVETIQLVLRISPAVELGEDGRIALAELQALGWTVRENPGAIELLISVPK